MFDQSIISEVIRPAWDGSSLHLEWTSTAPPGTFFQVYVDRALVWWGTSRWVTIPMPANRVRIDIGAVGPGEETTDFSAMLPIAPSDRARLNWLGGTYQDPLGNDDVAGFRIHGELYPGNGINYSTPLAEIRSYPGGILTDGYGLGGFGQGGFGRAASSYEWSSGPLGSGTWAFAIVPFDAAGNAGPPSIASVKILSPPQAPLAFPDGSRLAYTYSPTTHKATLSWRPSPA